MGSFRRLIIYDITLKLVSCIKIKSYKVCPYKMSTVYKSSVTVIEWTSEKIFIQS